VFTDNLMGETPFLSTSALIALFLYFWIQYIAVLRFGLGSIRPDSARLDTRVPALVSPLWHFLCAIERRGRVCVETVP